MSHLEWSEAMRKHSDSHQRKPSHTSKKGAKLARLCFPNEPLEVWMSWGELMRSGLEDASRHNYVMHVMETSEVNEVPPIIFQNKINFKTQTFWSTEYHVSDSLLTLNNLGCRNAPLQKYLSILWPKVYGKADKYFCKGIFPQLPRYNLKGCRHQGSSYACF